MNRRPFFRPGLVVAVALVAVTVQGLPAVADEGVVRVYARLVQVLAEDADSSRATPTIDTEPDSQEGSEDVVSMVEVDGRLLALPDGIAVDGATGDRVLLAIEGSDGARGADAVAATVADTNPATVVEIKVDPAEVAEVSESGTLAILPVYWSGGPSATTANLQTLGEATATYWSQQSGGAISTSVVVKPWIDARSAPNVSVPTSCSYEAMATLASQVMAANGYSATGSRRASVFFPHWSSCGWAGLGSVGGSHSWINGYTNPEILAHEYGHNLGLGHANRYSCGDVALSLPVSSCVNNEYGDYADVMGSGMLTGRPGNLNSAMADWLGLARVIKAQPGLTTTATLAPLGSVSSVRAVSVPVSGGTVYVDFRPNVSPDDRRPSWAGVQVRMQVMTSYYPTTYLLDMHPDQNFANPTLGAGESWQVPGTGLEITVVAVDGTSGAKVAVAPVGSATGSVTLGSDLGFVPVTPVRLLDTRATGRSLGAGSRLDLQVAGVRGVPSGAKAVAVNLTAVGPSAVTYLRAWPTGTSEPTASVLNVEPNATAAVATSVGVGAGGKVSLRNNLGSVNLVVDVTGYYVDSAGVGFEPLPRAVRLLDTRLPGSGLAPDGTRRISVAEAGVPSNATAVMVNVTSAAARGAGYVSVVPAGADVRATSTVNHRPGADVANRATVPVSGGKLDVYLAGGAAGVVIDVVGWYGPSGTLLLTPVVPQRVVDTRTVGGALKAGQTRTLAVRDAIFTSYKPKAALVTLTATQQTAGATYLTVGAAGQALPPTSDLNTGAGRDQAALALMVWDSSGASVVYNNAGTTQVIIDVTAIFR